MFSAVVQGCVAVHVSLVDDLPDISLELLSLVLQQDVETAEIRLHHCSRASILQYCVQDCLPSDFLALDCTKKTMLYLASMGKTGLSDNIFLKFSLGPFGVVEFE